ncbi:hypothetical protein A2704_06070 [Candidatus Kaiserbacteria bacterium RIFCSPHIGHO2_01_FULL_54_36b]|nr:MAG: hypothetical protein A2704_06070 [Candidatus Kaiserbacteria bacterium RIFCSPHIGHO2_01_FULL_54_36b]
MSEKGSKRKKICRAGCFYAGVGFVCYLVVPEIAKDNNGVDILLRLCAYAEMAIGGWLIPQGDP